jgi:hypothetical protein
MQFIAAWAQRFDFIAFRAQDLIEPVHGLFPSSVESSGLHASARMACSRRPF